MRGGAPSARTPIMLVALQDVLEPLGTATRLLLEALSVLTVLYGLFLGRDIEAEQRWEEEASRRAIARGVPASSSPPLP